MPDQLLKILSGHEASINCIRFTKDGTYCMTASDDKTIKLWNPFRNIEDETSLSSLQSTEQRAVCVQTYGGVHGYSILDVTVTNDKSKFASGGEDKTVFLWDVVESRVYLRLTGAHTSRINSLCYNVDGSVLYTASYDKTIKCWDLRAANSRDPIQILSDFHDSVTCVRQTEYTIMGSCVDGTVRIYDMRQGLMNCDKGGGEQNQPITYFNVSDDERFYLTTCVGGKLRLIDFGSGKILREYSGSHKHSSYKIESCIENNNTSILCGSEDGQMIHYNLLNGEVDDITSNAHSKGISSVAYHPTRDVFLSASHDGTGKLWQRKKN
jgi:mitogen-activated protein kinase organizer 1